ncbi:uncharacterized protein V1516DRAFT_686649 [Lipomyces oligophaga]|uniref:uncharacterized protein n=1 Tax=Lipomyces oligophaga TaxID=45792 RepID=UPI0034CF539E
MSLRVYNAHTGRTIDLNPELFLTIADLKETIAQQHGIPPNHQIVMTSRATQLRISNLVNETELYLFDRLLLSHPTSTPPVTTTPLLPLNTQPVPNTTNVKPSQNEMVDLFELRAAWSAGLLARAESLNSSLSSTLAEVQVIRHSVGIAMLHLKHHVGNINRQFMEIIDRAVNQENDLENTDWNASLARLDSIPVVECFGGGTLSAWIDHEKVYSVQADIAFSEQHIQDRIRDIKFVADKVTADSDALGREIELASNDLTATAEAAGEYENIPAVLEDLHAIVNKIRKDAVYIADLPSTPASMRSIARMAMLHQREYLPIISATVSELWEYNRDAQSRKAAAQVASLRHLNTLSVVQSRASPIRPDLASLERELELAQESLAILKQMDSLPLIYGGLLIESVQRAEWNERVRQLSGEVAEEFAVWKDDEQKRRTKWLKRFGGYIDTFQQTFSSSGASNGTSIGSEHSLYSLRNGSTSLFSVELNLVGSSDEKNSSTAGIAGNASIAVTREDVTSFLEILQRIPGTEAMLSELLEMIRILDRATQERSKSSSSRRRERLFKGSNYVDDIRSSMFGLSKVEAAVGTAAAGHLSGNHSLEASRQSSPNKDDSSALIQENRQLQEVVRGYESRVRRLEDLLHRQQFSAAPANAKASPAGSGSVVSQPTSSAISAASTITYQGQANAVNNSLLPASVSRHHSAPSDLHLFKSNSGSSSSTSPILTPLQPILQQSPQLPVRSSPPPSSTAIASSSPRASSTAAEFEMSRKRGSGLRLDRLANELQTVSIRSGSQESSLLVGGGAEVVADLHRQLQTAKKQLGEEKDNTNRLRKQITETELNLQEIEVVKEDLLANLTQQESEFQLERKSMNQEISELKARIYAMEEEEDNLEESRVDKEGLIVNLETALEEQQHRERDLETIKSVLDAEIFSLRETLRAEREQYSRLTNLFSESREMVDVLQTQVTGLNDQLAQKSLYDHEGLERMQELANSIKSSSETVIEEKISARLGLLVWQIVNSETGRDDLSEEEVQNKIMGYISDRKAANERAEELESDVLRLRKVVQDGAHKEIESEKKLEEYREREREARKQMANSNVQTRQLMKHLGIRYSKNKPQEMVFSSRVRDEGLYKILPESERERWELENEIENEEEANDKDLEGEEDGSGTCVDFDEFARMVIKRVDESEFVAHKWNKMARLYREKTRRFQKESSDKIAYRLFRVGDLALFLPTKSKEQVWAAFNDGPPYCFLREDEETRRQFRLGERQWMVGRISKIEEDVEVSGEDGGVEIVKCAVPDGRRFVVDVEEVDDQVQMQVQVRMGEIEESLGMRELGPGPSMSALAAASLVARRTSRGGENEGEEIERVEDGEAEGEAEEEVEEEVEEDVAGNAVMGSTIAAAGSITTDDGNDEQAE